MAKHALYGEVGLASIGGSEDCLDLSARSHDLTMGRGCGDFKPSRHDRRKQERITDKSLV
jgi:hypothetical protein